LQIVLDHLNQPPVSTKQQFGEWGDLVKEAASHQNIFAKISGLGNAANNINWNGR
jgi:L-fuconolactonase